MKIIYFDKIDSTNNYLKNNYKNIEHNTIIKANYQTNGRGQFDRFWFSNENENLLFSILLKDVKLSDSNYFKNKVTKALINLLSKYNIKGVFKEPNDILVNGNKILGILIETKTTNNQTFDYYIIGIGININQDFFLNLEATSFKILNNEVYNINEVLYEFINIFK